MLSINTTSFLLKSVTQKSNLASAPVVKQPNKHDNFLAKLDRCFSKTKSFKDFGYFSPVMTSSWISCFVLLFAVLTWFDIKKATTGLLFFFFLRVAIDGLSLRDGFFTIGYFLFALAPLLVLSKIYKKEKNIREATIKNFIISSPLQALVFAGRLLFYKPILVFTFVFICPFMCIFLTIFIMRISQDKTLPSPSS